MNFLKTQFLPWLMGLTTIMRYFVIALLFHLGLIAVLGSIKIVAEIPTIMASFTGAPLPPPMDDTLPDDPFAAYRDFDYSGPEMGGGGGLGGKGPGGVPTAGGTPEQYKASILTSQVQGDTPAVNEVIGVFSDAATAIARPSVGPSGAGMGPVGGIGDALAGTGGIKGPGGGIIGARMGPARAVNLRKHGGSERTEQALMAALRWLKANQKPNGSWDGPNPAVSAFAVLAFLGHGENADSPEFGMTVSKGIEYLVGSVREDGLIANGNMYHHGIVTIALAEALALTQSPVLRDPLERAVKVILDAQKVPKTSAVHTGGWRYTPKADTSDLSVAGWQIMAIKSAKNAGIDIPQSAFDEAAEYVWNQYGGTGFGYTGPGNAWIMTAVGLLSQIFLEQGRDRRLTKSLDMLSNVVVSWGDDGPGGHTIYGWYYAALAIFQGSIVLGKESVWAEWNKDFQKAILDNQKEAGFWDVPAKSNEGGHNASKVYATALCALMLEVYYRYLPIMQVERPRAAIEEHHPHPTGS